MRKIERQMLQAINTPGKQWSNSNTRVRWSKDQSFVEVLLHGHIIASINWATNKMALSDCGWQTVTTKSRLNALLNDLVPGATIYQQDFVWYIATKKNTVEFNKLDNVAFSF